MNIIGTSNAEVCEDTELSTIDDTSKRAPSNEAINLSRVSFGAA